MVTDRTGPGKTVLTGRLHLNYNYFRNYDPSLGRYVQSDPIGVSAKSADPILRPQAIVESYRSPRGHTLNPTYSYADDNPLNNYDPLGLEAAGSDDWVENGCEVKCEDRGGRVC
jgi:RHS repeat-associated protein